MPGFEPENIFFLTCNIIAKEQVNTTQIPARFEAFAGM